MKVFAFFVSFVLIALAAAKDPVCSEAFASNGDGPISCSAYMPSYSYNPATGQCEEFIYGGCRGNGNRFQSKAQCETMCVN